VDRGEGLMVVGMERGQRLRGREGGMQGGYGMNSEAKREGGRDAGRIWNEFRASEEPPRARVG
jgi:hypothetical protein